MYDNISIPDAKEFSERVLLEEKESLLNNRLEYQLKVIEDKMREGAVTARWIFSDIEPYREPIRNAWMREFDSVLADMFEEKGYIVAGGIISWP